MVTREAKTPSFYGELAQEVTSRRQSSFLAEVSLLFDSKVKRQAVADPGFSQGAPTPQGGCQHMILPNFPENCMKLKEFGCPGAPLRPPPPKSATGR